MVECHASDLIARVRFPLPAPKNLDNLQEEKMRKNIAEDKEKLKEKLEYIGLNLERIPKFLTEFTPFSFRPLNQT